MIAPAYPESHAVKGSPASYSREDILDTATQVFSEVDRQRDRHDLRSRRDVEARFGWDTF